MRPITAIAVVKKKNPRINILDIYPIKDKKDIRISKDEKIIKVEIKSC